jgi:hypothetical protein
MMTPPKIQALGIRQLRCVLASLGLALVLIGAAGSKGWRAVEWPGLPTWTCERKDCHTRCVNRTTQVQRVIINDQIWFFAPGSRITLSGPCQGEGP